MVSSKHMTANNKTNQWHTDSKKKQHIQRLNLIRPYLGRMCLGFIFMLTTIALQLSFPQVLSSFIDNAGKGYDSAWLLQAASLLFAALVIYCLCSAMRYYLFESAGSKIVTDIRRRLFSAIVRQEIGFFDTNKVAELNSRLSADVEVLRSTLSMELAIALRSLLLLVGGVVLLLLTSLHLSLLLVLVIPVSMLLSRWLGNKARDLSRKMQQNMADVLDVSQETFTNIRLVHSYNLQGGTNGKYVDITQKALNTVLENTRLFGVFQASSTFVSFTTLLIILVYGAVLMNQQALTVGQLASFIMYGLMVTSSVTAITSVWGSWMRSVGATERVFELIERQPEQARYTGLQKVETVAGTIRFENVSFRYPGRKETLALNHFDLSITAGEKIALIGPSGAGKSTLASLLLGFYQPTEGRILIDGKDKQQYDLDDLRRCIAIVEQEPKLFSGTIAENIGLASAQGQAALQDIEQAARLAYAHAFIMGFPDGYQTAVGDRGVQLSGGQKQRIAIARALLRNPRILILDEATSALDSESETFVQKALSRLMEGRTTIIIAHRHSSIARADRVIVLDRGRAIQSGTHQELTRQTGGMYDSLMGEQTYKDEKSAQAL